MKAERKSHSPTRDLRAESPALRNRLLLMLEHLQATAAYVVDQAVCSAGNFITSFLVARHLPPNEFGVFALLNIIMIFSLTMNNWLIRANLSEAAQRDSGEKIQAYTSALSVLAGAFGFLPALVLVAAATALHHSELTVALCLVAISAQVQETLRRSAMAQSCFGKALVGDAVSYLGQAFILLGAVFVHIVTLRLVFWTIGATSLLALSIEAYVLGLRLPTKLLAVAHQCWHHGRWVALSGVVLSPLVYGLPWILALTRGQTESARLSSLALVLGFSNPIMFSGSWLILVRGQTAKHSSLIALFKQIAPTFLLISIPLGAYWSVLFAFPRWTLYLFYAGRPSYLLLASGLRLMVIYYLASYVAVCLEVLTDSRDQSDRRIWIDVCASIITLLRGLWAASKAGLGALLLVGILVHLLRASAYFILLARSGTPFRNTLAQPTVGVAEISR